jgi:hypothetical protein
MIRRLQRVLADVRRTRDVYFLHVKSHQDDGVPLHDITDQAVLCNIRADKLVDWGKRPGPYCRLFDGGGEGDSIRVLLQALDGLLMLVPPAGPRTDRLTDMMRGR